MKTQLSKEEIKKQINAYLTMSQAIAEAIQEAGDDGLIEGHLWAISCQHYMKIDTFQHMIGLLTETGKKGEPPMVLKKHHVLKWNFEAYPIKKKATV